MAEPPRVRDPHAVDLNVSSDSEKGVLEVTQVVLAKRWAVSLSSLWRWRQAYEEGRAPG